MSEINAKGGVLGGRKFQWIVRDSLGKPENETRYCREMLVSENVDILHAGFGSSLGLAATAVVQEVGKGLAFLEGGKTSKLRIEKFNPRIFCGEQEDIPEARGMAKSSVSWGRSRTSRNPKSIIYPGTMSTVAVYTSGLFQRLKGTNLTLRS